MTEKQAKYVRGLLFREAMQDMEHELALRFTNQRTAILEDLTHAETQDLINEFKERSPEDKMKGKLLSMAHEMRWELPNGKVDVPRINGWLTKHTPYHKTLDGLTTGELPTVVSVFEIMYKDHLKSI